MTKSLRAAIVVLTLLVCGIGMVFASGQTEEGPTAQTVTEATELEGTITVSLVAGPGSQDAWQAVADGYEEIHPGVSVNIELKPQEGIGDWVRTQFSDPNPTADLININYAHSYKGDRAVNFMDYANLDSPYSDGRWIDQFNFELQTKDLATNEWDAISLESVQVLWVYNREIFAEVGVEPPTTWDEFVEVAEALAAAGYQPLAVAGDFNSFWAGQMGWLAQIYVDQTTRDMINVYRAQPGDYNYDPDVDGVWEYDPSDPFNDDPWKVNTNKSRAFKAILEGEYRGDTEGFKTVWENMARIFPQYAGGDAFFGTSDAVPLFYQGKAAILLDGAWRLPLFKNDMDKLAAGEEIVSGSQAIEGVQRFAIGTFNMPSMEGPGIVAPARTIEVPVGFIGAIRKDQAQSDLVVDFLMYYSSSEGFSRYMSAGLEAGWSPAGPSLVHGVELPEEYAQMFEDLEFIGNVQKSYGAQLARGAPADVQESLREWYSYTQELLTGGIDSDTWARLNQENIMRYIDVSMQSSDVSMNDIENPQNTPTGE